MSALLLLLALVGAKAQVFVVDGVRYSVAYAYPSGEIRILVSGCENVAGELVIPKTVIYEGEEYEVTGINWYDYSCGAELTSITIPSTVLDISLPFFPGCPKLQAIHVDEQHPWYSSVDGVLYDKEQTTLMFVPRGLEEICIPSSVSSIEAGIAFPEESQLQSIRVDEQNPSFSSVDGVLYDKGQTVLWQMPMKSEMTDFAIPASVTSIRENAFYGCTGLTSIGIPSSVTAIGDHTFQNCTGLTSIEIPSSVTTIGDYVFADCTSLTSIEIPSSVTTIDGYAFQNCTGLTSIEIPSSVTAIGDHTFQNCTGLTSIGIPSSVTAIGYGAFADCTSLTSIEFPSSVTAIGDGAFNNCTGLTSVTFEAPSALETIGAKAFYDCNLATMAVPPSVKKIGFQAFNLSSESPMRTFVVPHSVEYMEDQLGDEMAPPKQGQTFIVLNSNEDVIGALNLLFLQPHVRRGPTCYSTAEILEQIVSTSNTWTLYTVSDACNTGGTLSLSLTDIADDVLEIRALEIGGQRVEANESSTYTFEDVGEGTEFELVVYADILDTEYPIYQTLTVEAGEVGVGDVKSAGDGQPEVRGSLAEGRAQVRIPGDGGTAEWTLTATDGTAVAQGRAQADGNWQPLEGAQAAKGLYLLTVRCGQTAKTVKFMAR